MKKFLLGERGEEINRLYDVEALVRSFEKNSRRHAGAANRGCFRDPSGCRRCFKVPDLPLATRGFQERSAGGDFTSVESNRSRWRAESYCPMSGTMALPD
jgi:hypothetical protein